MLWIRTNIIPRFKKKDFRISELLKSSILTVSFNRAAEITQLHWFFLKTSFRTPALAVTLYQSLPEIHDHKWEWVQKLFCKLTILSFSTILILWQPNSAKLAFLHKPCQFEYPVSSSSCFPSLVNVTVKYLNFSTCFSAALLTSNKHWIGFLERWSTLPLALLILIPAVSYVAAKLLNACRGPDSEEKSRTKLSANSRRLTWQFPIMAHSIARLHLSTKFM